MQAIILSRRDTHEYDQIITAYTKEQGKKNFLARGVKKVTSKNSSFLEPYSVVEMEIIEGQELDLLLKVFPVHIPISLYSDIEKIIHVQKIGSIIQDVVREGEADEMMFQFLYQWLLRVDTSRIIDATEYYFLIKFLDILGFRPIIDRCVLDEKHVFTNEGVFSYTHGGIICTSCTLTNTTYKQHITPIQDKDVVLLQCMLQHEWGSSEQVVSPQAKEIIIQFGAYYLGKEKIV